LIPWSMQSEKRRGRRLHIWDKPQNTRRFIQWFFILCGLMLALDFIHQKHLSFGEYFTDANGNHHYDEGESFEDHDKDGQYDGPGFEGEGWFGFYGFYGLVACVVLVLLATQLRKILMRKESYYDR